MTNGPVVAPWDKSVLISGIGVAGPTLAYWLALNGFKTALVEKSPQLRTGGYIIDFWGRGSDLAENMGYFPHQIAMGPTLLDWLTSTVLIFRAEFSRRRTMLSKASDFCAHFEQ